MATAESQPVVLPKLSAQPPAQPPTSLVPAPAPAPAEAAPVKPAASAPLSPSAPAMSAMRAGSITVGVREIMGNGQAREFAIPVNFTNLAKPDGSWESVLTRAAFLAIGPMSGVPFGSVVCAVMYADSLGLDVMAKDVYTVDGKLSVSAEGKIKFADQSGLIEWRRIKLSREGNISLPYTEKQQSKTWVGKNLKAVVTVKLRSDPEPQVMEWELADFFSGSTAWRTDTVSMFSKRALGKTLGILVPTGVDAEDIPTGSAELPIEPKSIVAGLRAAQAAEPAKQASEPKPLQYPEQYPEVAVSK